MTLSRGERLFRASPRRGTRTGHRRGHRAGGGRRHSASSRSVEKNGRACGPRPAATGSHPTTELTMPFAAEGGGTAGAPCRDSRMNHRQRRQRVGNDSGGGTRTHNQSVNSRATLPIELPRNGLPGTGPGHPHCRQAARSRRVMPASTSAWQFAHSSTHLLASARALASDRERPTLSEKPSPPERGGGTRAPPCSGHSRRSGTPRPSPEQLGLHPPSPTAHRSRAALGAAVVAARVKRVLSLPVRGALHPRPVQTCLQARSRSPRTAPSWFIVVSPYVRSQ